MHAPKKKIIQRMIDDRSLICFHITFSLPSSLTFLKSIILYAPMCSLGVVYDWVMLSFRVSQWGKCDLKWWGNGFGERWEELRGEGYGSLSTPSTSLFDKNINVLKIGNQESYRFMIEESNR